MSQPKEQPCPDCGEMVRVNSLRCWNCGAFMNPEMEKVYLARQANPGPPILSEVPVDEMHSVEDDEGADDDFELSIPSPTSESAPAAKEEKTTSSEAADAPSEPAKRVTDDENAVPHSVATGGDALLDIAIQEEREVRKKQKVRRPVGGMTTPGGGLIIFCPYGCRVEVKQQHRGMTGKCPRCQAPFIVPVDPPQFKKSKKAAEGAGEEGTQDKYKLWLTDLPLHVVSPEKLKLKADSLTKEFVDSDVAFSTEHLLVAILGKKQQQGLFAKGGGDKKEDVREAMLAHLRDGKPADTIPVEEKYLFGPEEAAQLKVAQPAANRAESMFHGIPVFGAGRIAIQLPFTDKMTDPMFLSMGITQYWKFAAAAKEQLGVEGLGQGCGIPEKAEYSITKCHYTDFPIKSLKHVDYYKADPSVDLQVAGYQCGACKLTVSEAGRKKENLGGKSPKGIAKAKCPKCGSKMGENLLYALQEDVKEPSMSGESA